MMLPSYTAVGPIKTIPKRMDKNQTIQLNWP
uniref:Uncharacterized protein n=1 Tax=Anguilla anguilla TaxID=7936 RepID=A0A0E9PWW0_ANGAN